MLFLERDFINCLHSVAQFAQLYFDASVGRRKIVVVAETERYIQRVKSKRKFGAP